jgi:prepilin-type N-terminal cleavage/methylation domain-containing protein
MQRSKREQKGFTLLEILLVIATIGILAAIVIIAINPNKQLAQARDAQRRSDINTIYKASEQYLIDNGIYPSSVNSNLKEICNTGNKTLTDTLSPATLCDNKADLRVLVPTYLAAIPTAPSGGIYRIGTNGNNKIAVYTIGESNQTIAINFAVTNYGTIDIDAFNYITAIELADGQALEENVKIAINNFIVGLKTDGIWEPIKASVIMAGARTLNGALVPLKGTAPTNFNFVSADYNRKTGLVGNGSTKYLNSNRAGSADPQNSFHLALNITAGGSNAFIGGDGNNGINNGNDFRARSSAQTPAIANSTGFRAVTRESSILVKVRAQLTTYSYSPVTTNVPGFENILVFRRNAGTALYSNVRLSYYSIGESLDLALLDTRVTQLRIDLGNAIP